MNDETLIQATIRKLSYHTGDKEAAKIIECWKQHASRGISDSMSLSVLIEKLEATKIEVSSASGAMFNSGIRQAIAVIREHAPAKTFRFEGATDTSFRV